MDRTVLKIKINEKLYLRDPQETELGKRILSEGIGLIDGLGLERFTFKKLAEKIDSTEASIYRYFENKSMFLLYLTSWYWVWMDYQVQFHTQNMNSAAEKLKVILRILSQPNPYEGATSEIDGKLLHKIILTESPKSYLLKEVDAFNQEGSYRELKKFCSRISELILAIRPDYPYANSLAITVVETAHQQQFFAQHLSSLISLTASHDAGLSHFLEHLLFGLIESNPTI